MVHPVYVLMLVVAAFGFGHMIGYWRGGNRAEADATRLDWMLHQFASGKFVAYDPQYGEDSEELVMADLAARYEEE